MHIHNMVCAQQTKIPGVNTTEKLQQEHRITLVDDNTGVAILEKLKRLSSSREIHLQWVPSHVNIAGNEIADSLAKDGSTQSTINSAPLIYSELHSTYTTNKQQLFLLLITDLCLTIQEIAKQVEISTNSSPATLWDLAQSVFESCSQTSVCGIEGTPSCSCTTLTGHYQR
ncbi:RNase H domain-containing protein [Trichonephila clavipes]|nr:RNase H domain-containing protein [Trichonephila clavipes]